jgi:hypothetical protein
MRISRISVYQVDLPYVDGSYDWAKCTEFASTKQIDPQFRTQTHRLRPDLEDTGLGGRNGRYELTERAFTGNGRR